MISCLKLANPLVSSQALAKDAYVPMEELNRYMVNFATEQHEVMPYVDQPYSGPPLFPFQ